MLDVGSHDVGRFGFTERLDRDAFDQARKLARHAVDVSQCRACSVRQPRAFDHALGRTLHGGHGVLRVGLDGAHDGGNLPRRVARALGQALHLLGHHREPSARLTGRCGLDGGIQRQHVGLLGDVGNQLGDLADLLRRLAQALDALGRFLDLVADGVHAADGVVHRSQAAFSSLQRLPRHLRRLLRLRRHVVDATGHLQHGFAGVADLAQLLGGGGQEFGGGLLDLTGGVGHARHRALHLLDQRAKFFHGVVHRIGDGAGDVLGDGGLLRQVALGHRLQFVHEAKNGRLVGVVDALGFAFLALGLAALQVCHAGPRDLVAHEQPQKSECAHTEHQGRQQGRAQPPAADATLFREPLLQAVEPPTQRFAVGNDRGLRVARRDQRGQIAQDGGSRRAHLLVLGQQLLNTFAKLRLARARQAQFGVAGEHALRQVAESAQVAAQEEAGVHAHPFEGEELVGIARDALGQHGHLSQHRHLGGRRAGLQLQRRQGLHAVEQVGSLSVHRPQRCTGLGERLLLAQDHRRVLLCLVDQGQQGIDLVLQTRWRRGHTTLAVLEAAHVARQ